MSSNTNNNDTQLEYKSTTLDTHNNSSSNSNNIKPLPFNPKYNTKNINWNDLHRIAIEDTRVLYVNKIIQRYYPSYTCASLPPSIIRFMSLIKQQSAIVESAHMLLHSKNNEWKLEVDNCKNISVYYRKEHSSNIHSIKIEMECKCSALDMIAVLNEPDLMSETITFIPIELRFLKEFSPTHKLLYSHVQLWWPFRNRDCITIVRAYNLLHEYGEILLWGKSITADEQQTLLITDSKQKSSKSLEIPKCKSDTVRMRVVMAEGIIQPIKFNDNGQSENITRIIALFNIDFNSFLSQKLVNWITRKFSYYACQMIRTRTENLGGTAHEERINTKDVYRKWSDDILEWKQANNNDAKI